MVVSVTNRGSRFPRSHVLSKMPGDPLRLSWPVGNAGPAPSSAQAILSIFGRGLVAQGPVTTVPAGAGLAEIGSTIPLVEVGVTWGVDLAPGSYQLVSRVRETDPGGTELANHQFTLNVAAPAPPPQIVYAVGGLEIGQFVDVPAYGITAARVTRYEDNGRTILVTRRSASGCFPDSFATSSVVPSGFSDVDPWCPGWPPPPPR